MADIGIFRRIPVSVLPAADETDRLGREKDPSFLPGIFSAEDRDRKFSFRELPEQRLTVTGGDADIDHWIFFRVSPHDTRKTVAAVVDGCADGKRTSDNSLGCINRISELLIHLAHLTAVGDNGFSHRVEDYAFPGTDEKDGTEFLLNAAKALCESGLSQKMLVSDLCDIFRFIEIDQKLIVLFIHKNVSLPKKLEIFH